MNSKYPGHYCWCCGRIMPHERFRGRNHGRHLCRSCARLGGHELAYREAERNIERVIGPNGFIAGGQRHVIEHFTEHDLKRVRDLAARVLARDAVGRDLLRELRGAEARFEEWIAAGGAMGGRVIESEASNNGAGGDGHADLAKNASMVRKSAC